MKRLRNPSVESIPKRAKVSFNSPSNRGEFTFETDSEDDAPLIHRSRAKNRASFAVNSMAAEIPVSIDNFVSRPLIENSPIEPFISTFTVSPPPANNEIFTEVDTDSTRSALSPMPTEAPAGSWQPFFAERKALIQKRVAEERKVADEKIEAARKKAIEENKCSVAALRKDKSDSTGTNGVNLKKLATKKLPNNITLASRQKNENPKSKTPSMITMDEWYERDRVAHKIFRARLSHWLEWMSKPIDLANPWKELLFDDEGDIVEEVIEVLPRIKGQKHVDLSPPLTKDSLPARKAMSVLLGDGKALYNQAGVKGAMAIPVRVRNLIHEFQEGLDRHGAGFMTERKILAACFDNFFYELDVLEADLKAVLE